MTLHEFGTSWYLEANILLVFSFMFFRYLRRSSRSDNPWCNYGLLTRFAQFLVLLALFLPALFNSIPAERLPRVSVQIRNPLSEISSESKNVFFSKDVRPKSVVAKSVGQNFSKSVVATITQQFELWGATGLLIFLCCGFAVAIFRLGRAVRKLHRVIRDAVVVRQIGRVIILVSDDIAVPFSTLAFGSACVVLPVALVQRSQDLRIAIRHEIQHHRNRDTAWALFVEFLVATFFFNPAVYFWKYQIIELQEFSCDETLIGRERVKAYEYGRCLVRVAEAALGGCPMQVGTTCMATHFKNPQQFKSFLRRRIEMFGDHEKPQRRSPWGFVFGALTLFATAAVAYAAQQSLRGQQSVAPNPGQAALDPAIQDIANRVLQKAIAKTGARAGFLLVSDPQTGKLLAAANISKDVSQRGVAWSLAYLTEPASIMKGLVAAAAIDRKVTTADEIFDCGAGNYRFGHRIFHDWKSFGRLSTTDTVVNSSNIWIVTK
jgi:beta-lactamase regulating signal transducer with metallopeptidase domain